MYLNEAPYGGTAVGIESGAQYYFGKSSKELSLIECAVLSGLPQSPSSYSPFTGLQKAYVWRTQQVLRRMREDRYITDIQEKEADKQLESMQFATENQELRAPHFVAFVKDHLVEKFGSKLVESGGLKVTTTLDWKIQEKAQSIVKEEVTKAKNLKVSNGAAVVLDPKTGEILAMVGSKDYSASDSGGYKFNVAVQGLRQPGSAIKPITYAAAFKKGYTSSTVIVDVSTKYPSGDPNKPEYEPKNYDNKFRGPMQLRYALGNSINTIAVKVSALVGIPDVLRLANDMGIASLESTTDNIRRIGLSLTLGGGEVTLLDLTNAFGVFATNGLRHDDVSILKVTDYKGNVLYEYKPTSARQVLSSSICYLISDILSDNDARKDIFGPNSFLFINGKTVAVKTGTTDDKRDNWTIGYTPSVVVGTWVGNNDNSPMNPSLASGVTGAAPIWNKIMQEVLKGKKDESFVRQPDIIEMDIDAYGGGFPISGQPTRKERFLKGTEPTVVAVIYRDIKVSRHDGNKRANAVEIARGDYDTKRYVVFSEQDPVSSDGKNRWQEAIDAWIAQQSDSKFHPPTETYQGSDDIVVSIKDPADGSQVNSNDVPVRIEAASNTSVVKVEIYVDGNKKDERTESKFTDTIRIDDGSYRTIKARAYNDNGHTSEQEIHIGVNRPYATPSPTLTPTLSPTPTSSPTPTP